MRSYSVVGHDGIPESGDDAWWQFTAFEPMTLVIHLYPDPGDDLDLFLLEGNCDPGACVAHSAGDGNEQIEFPLQAGQTYIIVVDGPDTDAVGHFSIDVACQ